MSVLPPLPGAAMTELLPTLLLLCEDEALVRMLAEDSLEDAGFTIEVAADGAEGMRLLAERVGRFRGIVTDVRLGPGPDGWEVARKARELNPTVAVVYITGDSEHQYASRGVPQSLLVAKPFVPAQLINAITSLLVQADSQLSAGVAPQDGLAKAKLPSASLRS